MTETPWRRTRLAVTVLIAGLAIAACSSTPDSSSSNPPASLEGSSWVLATYSAVGSSGAEEKAAAGAPAVLTFSAATRLTGSTGCNTFGGVWTQNGSSVLITPGPPTTKTCSAALTAQETALIAELQRSVGFAIEGTTLKLSNSDGELLLTYDKA